MSHRCPIPWALISVMGFPRTICQDDRVVCGSCWDAGLRRFVFSWGAFRLMNLEGTLTSVRHIVAAVCVVLTHTVVCTVTTSISSERNRTVNRVDGHGYYASDHNLMVEKT